MKKKNPALAGFVFSSVFQMTGFLFFLIMGHIIALVLLLFPLTAVEVVADIRSGAVPGHLLVLHIILSSASFHKIDFMCILKNSYHLQPGFTVMILLFWIMIGEAIQGEWYFYHHEPANIQ